MVAGPRGRTTSPPARRTPRPARDLALAGFVVTAVTYGPARMGFGLFLPQLREDFGLGSALAGLLGGAVFTSFLLSALVAPLLTARLGPRAPVLLGTLLAAAGLLLVAAAPDVPALAVGLVVAGASPGLCWSPFNDAATTHLAERDRPRTLSVVSTGTTVGILLAGVLAALGLEAGLSWRAAWVVFAAVGLVAALLTLLRVPAGRGPAPGRAAVPPPLLAGTGRPVLAAASFGLTAAVYLAFAGDQVAAAGGTELVPASLAAPVLFVAYGTAGLLGLLSGGLEQRLGLRRTLLLIFAASGASLALLALPVTTATVLVSAALQGAAVMTFSAVLSFWTARIRPRDATRAFTVAILALAAGGAVGPPVAGLLLEGVGTAPTFLGAGVLAAVTGLALGSRERSAGPVDG